MGAASERRALLLEADDSYDPFLTVDINEYLIEEFPTLTEKQRQSVWHLCQNDDDFDLDSIHEQIDNWVYKYAESDPNVNLDQNEEEEDEDADFDEESDDDDDDETSVSVDLVSYLQENYDEIDEEDMSYMVGVIIWKFDYSQVHSQIDAIIAKYNDGDYDAELDDDEDSDS